VHPIPAYVHDGINAEIDLKANYLYLGSIRRIARDIRTYVSIAFTTRFVECRMDQCGYALAR
jgi:hypothetical protein